MNTNDSVPFEEAHFAAQPNTAHTAGVSSYDGLDHFQSESEASSELVRAVPTARLAPPVTATSQAPPVPYVARDSHYGRALATAAVAVLLAVVATGLLLRGLSGGEHTVSAPPAEVLAGQAPSKAEGSPRPEVRATARPGGDAATGTTGMAGVVRRAPGTVAPPAPVKLATAVRRPRAGVSRPTPRQRVLARAAGRQSKLGARTPSRRVSGLARPSARAAAPAPVVISADMPAGNQRSAPTMTAREPAAPELSAQVSVTTSQADSDELTFRWSAPVGTFADATASQTRFFCPATPQPVAVTVIVTDGNGAAASDTFTVQCVASKR